MFSKEFYEMINNLQEIIDKAEEKSKCEDCGCDWCTMKLANEEKETWKKIKDHWDMLEKTNGSKKPLHPGKVALDVFCHMGQYFVVEGKFKRPYLTKEINKFPEDFFDRFFAGKESITYPLAYAISKEIEGTDIRFWMDLQECYDRYMHDWISG